MLGRIIGGIILTLLGLPFVLYTRWFMENIGVNSWAEAKLGPGGSWLFYKLIGILVSLVGILLATGLLGSLLVGTVGRLFKPMG